jgi:cytochrome c biogenesis protein CcmG, thiol:disulfide interchange protein DsbE
VRPTENGQSNKPKLAGFLIVIATILWTPESSRVEVADLLQKLNMTAYARRALPPEFNGRMVDGREMSLASLQGKVVLLNFWAAWCLECRPEMPALERLHRELSAQGLAVIGINTRERAATIREYAKALGLTFPLILDPSGKINSAYGVIGLPTTFLIARDGRAVALAIGPREWSGKPARAVIQAFLAEPVALKETR